MREWWNGIHERLLTNVCYNGILISSMPKGISRHYTKELLAPLVRDSFSFLEVVRKLGVTYSSGSMQTHVARRIRAFGIDTSHFTGKGSNRGERHVGGYKKLPAEEILILRNAGMRTKTYKLRRAMLESGVEYVCGICKMLPFWNGKELGLEVEHKNGNALDNRIENLCFICPNCHSQTNTFCTKNMGKYAKLTQPGRGN